MIQNLIAQKEPSNLFCKKIGKLITDECVCYCLDFSKVVDRRCSVKLA